MEKYLVLVELKHPLEVLVWILNGLFFPQIAIANGVLTSNTGGRATNHFGGLDVAPGCHCRVQRTWCHCWVPLRGAIVACYGGCRESGAIAGCHCSVLWVGGRVTTNFGRVDVVALQGAIAGCHCSVLWWGHREGCHCRVPL